MQRYFFSLSELDQFTASLNSHPQSNACSHCHRNDQWISHGYVYEQSGQTIGKRILCAKRYRKHGCGRTRQLYLHQRLPHWRYPLTVLLSFIHALLQGMTVEGAYGHALGHQHSEPRQAWRWLNALWRRVGWFRSVVPDKLIITVRRRTRRLTVLVSTLQAWWRYWPDKPAIHVTLQARFC